MLISVLIQILFGYLKNNMFHFLLVFCGQLIAKVWFGGSIATNYTDDDAPM